MEKLEKLKEQFDHIYIDEEAVIDPVAQRFMTLFTPDKISIVKEPPLPHQSGPLEADEFSESKRKIYLKRYPGTFFKRCPGAKPGMVCCNYFVLNLGLQCHMNCSYCYLQNYINTPILTIYSNIEKALSELQVLADQYGHLPYRVGTGETIDSLGLDPLTQYSHVLIDFFKDYPQWTLELKTKSAHIDQFINQPHQGNVLVSWSINPQNIIESEEHGTASLEERFKAAEKCIDKGFQVTFHLDPMIWHPDWKESYRSLVDEICTRFKPQKFAPLSLGTLRFQPEQKHIMRERFGMKSWVTRSETHLGRDGKMRYDSKIRQEMYEFVLERFRHHDRQWRVSLCMETPENWATAMDGSPRKERRLEELFKPLPRPQRPTPSQTIQ